jgi:hypothetical protein
MTTGCFFDDKNVVKVDGGDDCTTLDYVKNY